MQTLLIAATEQEVQPFIAAHPGFDALICGAGVPSTLYHLQKRMQQIDYDLIIQAGIAGTFSKDINPGQTVVVKQDAFADLGTECEEEFKTIFDAGLADKNEFPFEEGWLINKNEIITRSTLHAVKAVTVNKVTDDLLQKRQICHHFSPHVESMEGAALHYVCLQEKIPFIQLRAVSNMVGERNKTKWKMKEAIESLNIELSALIHGLTN
ncbi:MAG TPA: futalosine hydrolase [Ferruginibacter sp.]|nr:futalosine hydrolase [Ferruginibacter sp.]